MHKVYKDNIGLSQNEVFRTQNVLMGIEDQPKELKRRMILLEPQIESHNSSQGIGKSQIVCSPIVNHNSSLNQIPELITVDINQGQPYNPTSSNKIPTRQFQLDHFHATHAKQHLNSTNVHPTFLNTPMQWREAKEK